MRKVERCPLCDAAVGLAATGCAATDYLTGDAFTVRRCGSCGLEFTDPLPDCEDEFRRYYPQDDYYGAEGGRRFKGPLEWMVRAFRRRRARRVLALKPRGRILDIGCGRGLLLRFLKERGWQCSGTELLEPLARFLSAAYGLDVRACGVRDCRFAPGEFDVVTMYHVLEHLGDPRETLREVRRILRPDGVLVVEVPNAASVQSRLSGSRWFHLDVPRHAVHFTPATLRRMLEECGFAAAAVGGFSAEYDPYGLVQSLLNLAGCRMNFLCRLLRREGSAMTGAKAWLYDLPLSVLAGMLLIMPATVLEALASCVRRNGTLRFVCRPASVGAGDSGTDRGANGTGPASSVIP